MLFTSVGNWHSYRLSLWFWSVILKQKLDHTQLILIAPACLRQHLVFHPSRIIGLASHIPSSSSRAPDSASVRFCIPQPDLCISLHGCSVVKLGGRSMFRGYLTGPIHSRKPLPEWPIWSNGSVFSIRSLACGVQPKLTGIQGMLKYLCHQLYLVCWGHIWQRFWCFQGQLVTRFLKGVPHLHPPVREKFLCGPLIQS